MVLKSNLSLVDSTISWQREKVCPKIQHQNFWYWKVQEGKSCQILHVIDLEGYEIIAMSSFDKPCDFDTSISFL